MCVLGGYVAYQSAIFKKYPFSFYPFSVTNTLMQEKNGAGGDREAVGDDCVSPVAK